MNKILVNSTIHDSVEINEFALFGKQIFGVIKQFIILPFIENHKVAYSRCNIALPSWKAVGISSCESRLNDLIAPDLLSVNLFTETQEK